MGGGTKKVLKKAERGTKRGFNRLGEVDPFRILPQGSKGKKTPGASDAPQFDAGKEEELKQALIARLMQSVQRGTGRQATIGTSRAGVTTPSPTKRRTLRSL